MLNGSCSCMLHCGTMRLLRFLTLRVLGGRFPRYIQTREDKTIEEASSPEVITDLYNKQSRKMSSAKAQLEAQKRQDQAAQQADSGSDTAEAPEDNQEADPPSGMDAE